MKINIGRMTVDARPHRHLNRLLRDELCCTSKTRNYHWK